MRKIVIALLIILVFAMGTVFVTEEAFARERAATVVGYEVPRGQYRLVNEGRFDRFTNNVDGYSLLVPRGMTVDMSISEVGAFLKNDDIRIEIYRQYVGGIGRYVYINYSKRFLYNTLDHTTHYRGWRVVGENDVAVTSWSRRSLARVENDKNNYVTLEISIGNYVYSIFIKSNTPLSLLGGYQYILDDFRLEPMTAPPFVRRTSDVDLESRGWNEETLDFFLEHFSPCAPLRWGIFEPTTALFDYSKLLGYEEFFDYTFAVLLNYSEFQNTHRHPNLRQRLDMAWEHDRVLVLTLQTPLGGLPDGTKQVYRILDGEYDEFLRDYAQVIADFGHPVIFRLGNEMNGDWCDYSAFHLSKDTVLFREWWRYVYSFFEETGANANTIWLWNPNGESKPDFKWNHELMYYPGDRYVDLVGLTKYNTGTFYYWWGETWQEFYELYDELYARYTKIYGQPLMIPEFASASMGGDKEQWVIDMFAHFANFPSIKIAIWWDGADWDEYGNVARSYFIDETPGLMEIFREHLIRDWGRDSFG